MAYPSSEAMPCFGRILAKRLALCAVLHGEGTSGAGPAFPWAWTASQAAAGQRSAARRAVRANVSRRALGGGIRAEDAWQIRRLGCLRPCTRQIFVSTHRVWGTCGMSPDWPISTPPRRVLSHISPPCPMCRAPIACAGIHVPASIRNSAARGRWSATGSSAAVSVPASPLNPTS